MELGKGGTAVPIELWTARMERPLSDREREAMLPLLPPERRERLLRVRQEERRKACCGWSPENGGSPSAPI